MKESSHLYFQFFFIKFFPPTCPPYPNPFNPTTSIKFALAETQQAELKVFDVLGNEIAILFSGIADGGKVYKQVFDAINLSSGIYFYRIETENRVVNKKMLLPK